jgi:hypothetical protein
LSATGQHYISDAQRTAYVEDLRVWVFEGADVDEILVSITWGQLTKNLAKPAIDFHSQIQNTQYKMQKTKKP